MPNFEYLWCSSESFINSPPCFDFVCSLTTFHWKPLKLSLRIGFHFMSPINLTFQLTKIKVPIACGQLNQQRKYQRQISVIWQQVQNTTEFKLQQMWSLQNKRGYVPEFSFRITLNKLMSSRTNWYSQCIEASSKQQPRLALLLLYRNSWRPARSRSSKEQCWLSVQEFSPLPNYSFTPEDCDHGQK